MYDILAIRAQIFRFCFKLIDSFGTPLDNILFPKTNYSKDYLAAWKPVVGRNIWGYRALASEYAYFLGDLGCCNNYRFRKIFLHM